MNATGMDVLQSLDWRLIGPFRAGRVVAVTADPHDPATFYFGSTGGGVWKSTDAGQYWQNVSDGFFQRASVGAIAVAPSDPNVIYVGMGESTIRANVSHGDGVYKSTDAGKTWRQCGLEQTRNIARVVIHPDNPDIVYVAAFGHAHGPNPERGLYRSLDGGATWELVLHRSDRAGANYVVLDPHNPRIVYAAFWEAERGPHFLSSGGPGSGLFKSTDGGTSWWELSDSPGMPSGPKGKIEVAVSTRDGRVWAIIQANESGVYRSDDGGDSWQLLTSDSNLTGRPWYFNHIRADPVDGDTVWVLNFGVWRSSDGGSTFQQVASTHGDNHDLWIDPNDTRRMILGNDGGACVSLNGAESWSTIYNQPTAEFYHVTTDTQFPYRVYGAQQDNTTITVPSRSRYDAITLTETYEVGGGECGYIAVRPDDPNIVFAGATQGFLTRYDHRTGQLRDVTVWPEAYRGWGAIDLKYRFNWTAPVVLSVHEPGVLLFGGNHLFRSRDEGASWEAISPDLSRADPATLQPSGGPINKDNVGAEIYATVFAIAESPLAAGVIWAGTDDGLVHITRDDGTTWQNVTPAQLPEWALCSIIEASPYDPAVAYLAATCYRRDDFTPYLFKTADYGQTWTPITAGIPADDFTRVIRSDPARQGLLYAGTETGIYVSFDDGAQWHRLGGNLPVVPIHDLMIKADDLVVCTHGRAFWILDDTGVIRELPDVADNATAHLYTPAAAYRYSRRTRASVQAALPGKNYHATNGLLQTFVTEQSDLAGTRAVFLDAGTNPPDGVAIRYLLRQEPGRELVLSIHDDAGNEIRRYSSQAQDAAGRAPAKTGLNQFVWNLRYPPSRKILTKGGDQANISGPIVLPGTYEVRLQVDDLCLSRSFAVRQDPRLTVSRDDVQQQFDLVLAIRDKLSETNDAINQIRATRTDLKPWLARPGDAPEDAEIAATGRDLTERLDAIEAQLIAVKVNAPKDSLKHPVMLNAKLARVALSVATSEFPAIRGASVEAAPTRQSADAFQDLSRRIDAELAKLRDVLERGIPALNDQIRRSAAPPIGPGVMAAASPRGSAAHLLEADDRS